MILKQNAVDISNAFDKWNLWKSSGGTVINNFYIKKLLDGDVRELGEHVLSENIDNYDIIIITADVYVDNKHGQLTSLVILKEDYYYHGNENWSHVINLSISGNTRRITFYFSSGDRINITSNSSLAIRKIYGIKSHDNSHKYSENEQIIGEWIDGRKIYEKTLIFENMHLSSGFNDIYHKINDIDMYIDIKCNYTSTNNSNLLLSSHLNTNGLNLSIGTWCDDREKIRLCVGNDMQGNYNVYITIQYVKSTLTH